MTHAGAAPPDGRPAADQERASGEGRAYDENLTHGGQVMGTLSYMSPEQAQDAHLVDARSDIYSLGCTLYYLLAGKPPYGGETAAGKILLHRGQPIPSLRAVRPEVSESLEAVFRKMLAKKPEDRQASMAEVVAALEACPEPTAAAAPLRRRVRRPLLVATALVGLAALLALAVMLLKLRTTDGTLIVQVNDAGVTVQVLGEDGALQQETKAGKGTLTLSVAQGKHRLRVERDGQEVFSRDFVLSPRETMPIKVAFDSTALAKPAPPAARPVLATASAPFDAAKARQLQEAWANALGVPVENRNSIGMTFVFIPPGEFDMGFSKEEVAWAVEQGKKNKWPWYSGQVPARRCGIG